MLLAGCKSGGTPHSQLPVQTDVESGSGNATTTGGTTAGSTGGSNAQPDPTPDSADSGGAPVITGVRFDFDTLQEAAPGSDNWVLTWADDDSQYTSWGDGGGFGGTDQNARVSMGVARIDGDFDSFSTRNVWGGKNSEARATFEGKSYGMLAVNQDLWLWRTGNASNDSAFDVQDLYVSRDNGKSFESAGVSFRAKDFPDGRGFFAPTFLQFGPGYRDARDQYAYIYAPENKTNQWQVQVPGEISLMRVPADRMDDRSAYEFFSGLDSRGSPQWSSDVADRKPAFRDAENGVMRTSVTYNAGLDRYLLITQQRTTKRGGYIGIYEAPAPWGPWHTVLLENAWKVGLQDGEKSVYWNFSNKWTSPDGKQSVLVYTGPGPDNFGAVVAEFETVYD